MSRASVSILTVMRMFVRMVGRVPVGHLWYLWKKLRNEKIHRFNSQVRINTFFPPYPSKSFDNFCNHVIARRRVPISVYMAVTDKCPFTCSHCSLADRAGDALITQQWQGIIEQMKSMGVCIAGFTGGEPLSRPDLPELVAVCKKEMTTIVFTTGWGLDEPLAKKLKNAQLDCITFGMESDSPNVHDKVRGVAGSFEAMKTAIEVAKKAGLYTAVSTIGTHERISSGELDRMYELASKWGVEEFRLLAPVATGKQRGCGAFMLDDNELSILQNFHKNRNASGKGPAVASFAYLESAEMFGCGAGYHHLFIDHAGEVCPCDLTPLSFGNVTQQPLDEIWLAMAEKFSRPRCSCLMGQLADVIPDGELPVKGQAANNLVSEVEKDSSLPNGYSRLLR